MRANDAAHSSGVKIQAGGEGDVSLSVHAAGALLFADKLPCRGDAIEIGVNGQYMVDALSDLDCDSVSLLCDGPQDPIVMSDGARLAVIMPMRI
jgi:DNA polymerase III sliding clamp (beta) subunit (PCNA family)